VWAVLVKTPALLYNSFVLKETRNWIESSEYDLKTAEHMMSAGRYLYVVFMCHLAIEKLLKAIVHETTGGLPPKSQVDGHASP
jgi:HEPN domain-containing protein